MLEAKRFDRIASGLAASVPLLTGSTIGSWAQDRSVGPTSPPPAASGSAASTVLTIVFLAFLTAVAAGIVIVVRYMATRRKRLEEALVLQARVTDSIFRESQLRGLVITPKARVPAWRRSPMTMEVAGEVPTPELRDTVLRLVRAEVSRGQSDVVTRDLLYIVPPMHRVP